MPGDRGTMSPVACARGDTVESVVTSGPRARSSSSARRTTPSTSAGSSPAADSAAACSRCTAPHAGPVTPHPRRRRASAPAAGACARGPRGRSGARGGPPTRAGCPGASERRWAPRLSVRARAAAVSRLATVCSAVASSAARSSGRSAGNRGTAASAAASRVRPCGIPDDAGVARGRRGDGRTGGGVDRRRCARARPARRRRAGRAASRSAQRRAATSPSVIEFDASRFAPWTPVQATSPTANSPSTDVRPSRSASTPPHV